MSWRKRNKAASWKTSSLILILCPNTMGSRIFFGGGHIPGPSQRGNDGVIWVSITFCLSWLTFSEGSQSNWTMTVWPSALWKSMCKCCGLLFLPGKVKHCRARWQQGGRQPLKTMFLHPLCFHLSRECSLPAICICKFRKNLPYFCWRRFGEATFSFKRRGWEVLHFWHT